MGQGHVAHGPPGSALLPPRPSKRNSACLQAYSPSQAQQLTGQQQQQLLLLLTLLQSRP